MPDNLKGKVAIVTGSGQGIGRAIAIAMAREGAAVVTNNRKKGSTGLTVYGDSFAETMTGEEKEIASQFIGDAETVAAEITKAGGKAVPFFGDVGDFKAAGELVKTAIDHFGKIDIVVNNAGTFRHGYPWEMSEEDWDAVTYNKPKSAFNTIRHALPFMIQQRWGRIINCTSTAWLGQNNHPNYSAANAGVVGLTRSVARDVLKYGITCNAYAPGALTRATFSSRILIKRLADEKPLTSSNVIDPISSEMVAPFIVYLASDAAANISGTVFLVNRGHIGRYSNPQEIARMDKPNEIWTVDELIEKVPEALLQDYRPAYRPERDGK
jgi:3-oxoacyl-[acyl-carrier protein] reductase